MTQLDPYNPFAAPDAGPHAGPHASRHGTPTPFAPADSTPGDDYRPSSAGGHPPHPGGAFAPSGPTGYPAPLPERRLGVGAIIGILLVVALLIAGLGTGAYFLLRRDPSPAPGAAYAPAAPAAPTAPTARSLPSAPSGAAAPAAADPSGTTGSTSLSQVFPASTGTGCTAYTPAAGEYVTSAGHQAGEVRACAGGTSGGSDGAGVVYTRWPSPGDAASVVSDQARTTTSVNGKDTWTMGGTTQGDYHEARQSDGTCRAFLDYTAAPYAVVLSAPTCTGVEQLFQQTTLPDAATLPR